MYKPHTIEQYKIQQFLNQTFAMEHFLVSPLSRTALMLEDRTGERIAFSFLDGEVRETPLPPAADPEDVKSANKKSIGEWRKMMKRKRAYQKRPDGKMRWPDRKICIKECYS